MHFSEEKVPMEMVQAQQYSIDGLYSWWYLAEKGIWKHSILVGVLKVRLSVDYFFQGLPCLCLFISIEGELKLKSCTCCAQSYLDCNQTTTIDLNMEISEGKN